MENKALYFTLGFIAQGLFSARMLIQWILSEKEKKVVSPTVYWQISLLASFLLLVYGWLRNDFVILFGQFFSYYIYIWNLNNRNHWRCLYPVLRAIIISAPVVLMYLIFLKGTNNLYQLFHDISRPLLIFGSMGQIIFTFRFIYQWWYSRKKGVSLLPKQFWSLSLIGSSIIIIYGVYRKDPVLILGQSVGFITYIRNLNILQKQES